MQKHLSAIRAGMMMTSILLYQSVEYHSRGMWGITALPAMLWHGVENYATIGKTTMREHQIAKGDKALLCAIDAGIRSRRRSEQKRNGICVCGFYA